MNKLKPNKQGNKQKKTAKTTVSSSAKSSSKSPSGIKKNTSKPLSAIKKKKQSSSSVEKKNTLNPLSAEKKKQSPLSAEKKSTLKPSSAEKKNSSNPLSAEKKKHSSLSTEKNTLKPLSAEKKNTSSKSSSAKKKKNTASLDENNKNNSSNSAKSSYNEALYFDDDDRSISSTEQEYQDIKHALSDDLFADVADAPTQDEDDGERRVLIVRNLPDSFCSSAQLKPFFSRVSTVTRCEVNPKTSTAYVQFVSEEIVDLVINRLDYYLLDNSVLRMEKCELETRELEEKIWTPAIEESKKLKVQQKLTALAFGKSRNTQLLEHYSAHIPEKCYVLVQQRLRDLALQEHLRKLVRNEYRKLLIIDCNWL